VEKSRAERKTPSLNVRLSVVAVFSALIAVGTAASIPAPPPLGEITWSPPIYLALAVLAGPWVGFEATAIGSFIGEAANVSLKGFPPIYAPGIVWARAPEALIVGWARKKSRRTLAIAMVGATVFETLAFFFPDWAFYSYGLFYGSSNTGVMPGLAAASLDLLTMVDIIFIPVAFVLIREARPAFRRLGFT
jgi:ECF-type riboflavin transporter, S component